MVAQPTGLWIAVDIERGEGAGGQKVQRDTSVSATFINKKVLSP